MELRGARGSLMENLKLKYRVRKIGMGILAPRFPLEFNILILNQILSTHSRLWITELLNHQINLGLFLL